MPVHLRVRALSTGSWAHVAHVSPSPDADTLVNGLPPVVVAYRGTGPAEAMPVVVRNRRRASEAGEPSEATA